MKKIFTLTTASCIALAAMAYEPGNVLLLPESAAPVLKNTTSKVVRTYSKPDGGASRAYNYSFPDYAHYPAPAGVYFLGLDRKGNIPAAEYAMAPCNVNIVFHAPLDLSEGDYEWDYINAAGKSASAENEDITMNVSSTSVVDAPYLYCWTYSGTGGYTMARDGIAFGYGSIPDDKGVHYMSSNLNSILLGADLYDVATLSVNYGDAGKNFADSYPLKISDVTVKGFAELFRYAAPYSFDEIRADVIYADGTGSKGDISHLEADIYPYDSEKGVDFDHLLATYPASEAIHYDTYQGARWVCYEFAPAAGTTAPVITSDVMVIIRPSDGNTEHYISPTIKGVDTYYSAEPHTAFVYCAYTRGGNRVENGCLDYSGVEVEGSRASYYSHHWNVGGKMNYAVEAGITSAVMDEAESTDTSVYNLTGVKVADESDMSGLPSGIYIVKGKKIIIRK
ncbi:MAG: T9SS type A sorting domain-containing protein [Muribaculaceae bacterium]|nr:T9SS type A sorting domain-containing protein [Muribaculaceae bacterium]